MAIRTIIFKPSLLLRAFINLRGQAIKERGQNRGQEMPSLGAGGGEICNRNLADEVNNQANDFIGAPGGIRTPDSRLRRPMLYPAELQAHSKRSQGTASALLSVCRIPQSKLSDLCRASAALCDRLLLRHTNIILQKKSAYQPAILRGSESTCQARSVISSISAMVTESGSHR